MIATACVDAAGGMMFNRRRQSRDRVVRQQILQDSQGCRLWMNAYSCSQFSKEEQAEIRTDAGFLEKAGEGDWCFVEDTGLLRYEARIRRIVLFNWNKKYPADFWFDIPLKEHGWKLKHTQEIKGFSHEKITKETYQR